MKFNFLPFKAILTFLGISMATIAGAQCPSIACPGNISVVAPPGSCGAVVTFTAPVGTDPCNAAPVTQTFNYTGAVQTWTVPAGVTSITVDVRGAGGGNSGNVSYQPAHIPGIGGRTQATVAVTPGQVLNVYVGQRGGNFQVNAAGIGGWNGGANSGYSGFGYAGGGGGGASDIRIGGTALTDRKVVAGGGGGCGYDYDSGENGGNGGGITANNGTYQFNTLDARSGKGGTNAAGGIGGVFSGWGTGIAGTLGNGGNGGNPSAGGGGGGGYYGGGGGAWGGGGGGSSFADPLLTSGVTHTIGGGNTSNGTVAITYSSPVPATTTQIAGLASGATFPVGTTTNTFQVTGGGGSTTTCSFTVTVTDNEFPTLNCPADISVGSSLGVCGALVTYTAPVGTDNCPGTSTVQTAGLASGSIFPIGTTTNIYVATDAAGNATPCSFNVTVTDTETPAIICPTDITTSADAGVCGAIVTYTTPVGTDNCPGAATSYINGGQSGDLFPTGVNTVTYEVVDNAGLTASCSFNVTITDDEDPTILCPADVSTCVSVVNNIAPGTSADNCGVASIAFATTGATTLSGASDASGQTFNVGTTNVVYTATDAEGNTGTCDFDVVIVAPTNTLAGTSGSTESNTVNVNGTTDALNTDCDLIASVTPSGVDPLTGNANFSVTIDPTVSNYNGQTYVQRHFDIEPSVNAATATADVTLYVLQSEFDAFNAASAPGDILLPTGGVDNGNVKITQYHGTGTAPGNYTGSAEAIIPAVSWDAVNNWWELTFPVTGFSGFYIHTGYTSNPLAIHLKNITANNIGSSNKVNWATATEERNDKFGLEHSVDGINFKEIYNTPAKGSAAQYAYLHESPVNGKNYYRLKLYNNGEKFTYSNVVTATVKGANNFSIETYPNPVQNTLTVKVTGTTESDSHVVLTDIAGKVIATQAVTNNTAVFDMANQASGIYFIRYTDKSHSEVLKVNKH